MGTKRFICPDELGIRRTLFTNGSIEEIISKHREMEDYELILVGGLLGYIDQILQTPEDTETLELDRFQRFPELNLAVLILQSWNLFNPEDLKKIVLLAEIFESNSSRFLKNPGKPLSQRAQKIIKHRLHNFASSR